MTRDRRSSNAPLEIRATADGERLEGYAAVFNRETVIGGRFREVIRPGAFTASLASHDVIATFNHDPNYTLGRKSNGTLIVTEDGTGLRYQIALNPQDPDAQRVVSKVRRRDITGSSFSFAVAPADEQWRRDGSSELPLRIVTRAIVYDVGPVAMPVYADTTADARQQGDALSRWTEETGRRQLQWARVALEILEAECETGRVGTRGARGIQAIAHASRSARRPR